MRGNRSELTPEKKSPRCHLNTPLPVIVPVLNSIVPYVTRIVPNVTSDRSL